MKRFTLIELIIVVAIIALLLSLLMPSLSRARSTAEAAVCRSNLRQLNSAMQLYIKNAAGSFPQVGVVKGVGYHSNTWAGKSGTGSYSIDAGKRPLNQYLSTSVDNESEMPVARCSGLRAPYKSVGSSYSWNNGYIRWNIGRNPLEPQWHEAKLHYLSQVSSATRLVLVSEAPVYGLAVNAAWAPATAQAAHSHLGTLRFIMNFVDGHVEVNTMAKGLVNGDDWSLSDRL